MHTATYTSGTVAARDTSRLADTPLAFDAVRLDEEGFLGAWQRRNRLATLPHCIAQLEASGTLPNMRRVTGESTADFVGFHFSDSDIYKVLEAIGWEAGRSDASELLPFVDETVALLARAQRPDGYLNSFFQSVEPDRVFADLRWGHELYCLGHLLQAGVAWARTTARTDLLEIGLRFASLVETRLGEGAEEGVCGHPVIETALVEVFRLTGEQRYLALAQRFIDLRGRQLVGPDRFGYHYFQDHESVRQVQDATGHVVRQLYLAAGIADAYVENGDDELLDALERIWRSAHHEKQYITGGLGSRHRDEAFGDPFELPPDRAYSETCAAIANLMFNWRMLLITGEARFADEMERGLLNTIAESTAIDGVNFFYSNPLQIRTHRDGVHEQAPSRRVPWYDCACCPPNLARLLSSLHDYVATTHHGELRVHLYASAEVRIDDVADRGDAGVMRVTTEYPWAGAVRLDFDAAFHGVVGLRVPGWAETPSVTVDGIALDAAAAAASVRDGYLRIGDGAADAAGGSTTGIRSIELDFAMPVRVRRPHPLIDASRGTVAVTRGPIVYVLEQAGVPVGVELEEVVVAADAAIEHGDRVLGAPSLRMTAARRPPVPSQPYPVISTYETTLGEPIEVSLVPYALWGNRDEGGMRVWLPTE